ncbi:MAG TPA: hypothetical protein VIM62_08820, partial [Acidobacteriaceae bacterium]
MSPRSANNFRRAVVLLLLLHCAAAATARTRPHYGGSIRIATDGDPMQKPSGLAWQLTLDGLTQLDKDGALRPALADR